PRENLAVPCQHQGRRHGGPLRAQELPALRVQGRHAAEAQVGGLRPDCAGELPVPEEIEPMPSTLDRLAYEAGQLLKVLGTLATADGGPVATRNALGWDAPPGSRDTGLAAIDVSALLGQMHAPEESPA